MGSACLPACLPAPWNPLAEREAGRQIKCAQCLPIFWAAPSNFLCLPSRQFVINQFHTWEAPILVACPLRKHIRIKHVRSANWGAAPTCPQGCFLFFEGVSQLGGANMPPRDVYYLFEGVGDFPSSPQTVTIEFLSFPSKSHQNPFVLINFPNNSHQIPPVPINSTSKFFCSRQVSIKFLLFPSSFNQIPFVPITFSKSSHQAPLVPINILLFS